jgi:hypothetical protein
MLSFAPCFTHQRRCLYLISYRTVITFNPHAHPRYLCLIDRLVLPSHIDGFHFFLTWMSVWIKRSCICRTACCWVGSSTTLIVQLSPCLPLRVAALKGQLLLLLHQQPLHISPPFRRYRHPRRQRVLASQTVTRRLSNTPCLRPHAWNKLLPTNPLS